MATGVSVDLSTLCVQRRGVPLDRVVADAALKSVATVKARPADTGCLAIDPQRSDGAAVTAPVG